ncbi:MAG: DUF58 domain-containing protein [Lentisphaeria bacterium]|nr:DUF58 domain-containing protein [Lentisphaeria bacterium]
MMKRLRRLKNAFYAGPRFLGVQPWRRGRYQSPTLTAGLWLYALAVRHLTMAGGLVFLCCGLVTLYALFTLRMPIYILAFSLLALLLTNLVGAWVFRPRVEVERSLPARLGVGWDQPVTYLLRKRGRRPAWDLILDPMPLPRFLSFPAGRAAVPALAAGESLRLTAFLRARRRGRYVLPQTMVSSAFPFHLWRQTCAGRGDRTVIVYPAFTPLEELALPTGLRYQSGGIALSSKVGNSMEFQGTREFRDGDDPRRIHWRSWARTSFPVVKEFCEEYLCRTALIVDTHALRPYFWEVWMQLEDPVFEAALSLAAAVADRLFHRDTIIDLFAAGPEVYRFQGGRSLGFLENILDILACLGPHYGEPFAAFRDDLIEEVARISSAVVVLTAWNDVRRELLEQLQMAGVGARAVLVTGRPKPPDDLPSFVTLVRAKDVLEGRCTRL